MARKKKTELQVIDTKEDNILLEDKFDKIAILNELKEYIDERVNDTFFDELEKSNKKLIREKSKKIFWRNVIIVILLLIIGFLSYLLYANNYFDKFFNKEPNIEEKEKKEDNKDDKKENNQEEKKEEKEDKKEEPKAPTLEDLKKEFGSLLDNYYVTDSSIYLSDFYDGKLTNDMMKYMTMNTFNFSTLEKEEDYNIIKESTFKLMFNKMFLEEYSPATFNYDENKIRYVKQMESYMSEDVLVKEDNNIEREIKDIKVDGDKVIITTVEGVVKDNKLYNVLSNNEIEYKGDSLLKYEDKLNTLTYTFKDKKLISLSK